MRKAVKRVASTIVVIFSNERGLLLMCCSPNLLKSIQLLTTSNVIYHGHVKTNQGDEIILIDFSKTG